MMQIRIRNKGVKVHKVRIRDYEFRDEWLEITDY